MISVVIHDDDDFLLNKKLFCGISGCIVVCGKTGTVENYAKVNGRVEKQQDHSFFGAFAPKDNPRIAIAVICENAGQGAWAAAPIASLLIEKYLKDSISGTERKEKYTTMVNKNLIPKLMRLEMAKNDSLKQLKESRLEQQRLLQESIEKAAEEASGIERPILPNTPTVPKKSTLKEAIIPKNGDKKKKYAIS